jgi:hypothetical protein
MVTGKTKASSVLPLYMERWHAGGFLMVAIVVISVILVLSER